MPSDLKPGLSIRDVDPAGLVLRDMTTPAQEGTSQRGSALSFRPTFIRNHTVPLPRAWERCGPGVRSAERHRLQATARPSAADRLKPGGIYVHRWFVIATPSLAEFVDLSTTGWRDFEARFDTNIFGLFTAEQTPQDKAAGQTRLLLLTRYRDHGVWEESRNPTTDAMAAFQRRQLITRDTWNVSTLLVTP